MILPSNRLESIAQLAYEINRGFKRVKSDDDLPSWDDAELNDRESMIHKVKLYVASPDLTFEQAHAAWVELKEATGWVQGDTLDYVLKTHPHMVPFAQLSTFQKDRSELFKRGVTQALQIIENGEASLRASHSVIAGNELTTSDQVDTINLLKSLEASVVTAFNVVGSTPNVNKASLDQARLRSRESFMWAIRAVAKPNE